MKVESIYKGIKLMLSFLIMILFYSCKKDLDTYQISGHVFYGCPFKGEAGTKIVLSKSGGFGHGASLVTSAITDSNGYFKLESNENTLLFLEFYGGGTIINGMNPQNTEGLKIYRESSAVLNIYLNVTKTYSNADTLFIPANDSLGQPLQIIGPFNSGFLYSVSNYRFKDALLWNCPPYNSAVDITYHVNSNSYSSYGNINLNLCDTSSVTLNIN